MLTKNERKRLERNETDLCRGTERHLIGRAFSITMLVLTFALLISTRFANIYLSVLVFLCFE